MSLLMVKHNNDQVFKEIKQNFDAITKEPTQFLRPQPEKCVKIQQLLQQVYTATASGDVSNQHAAEILPELVLEGMDEEQIWQQLELRNNVVMPQLLEQSAKLMALREEKLEIRLNEANEEEEVTGDENDELSLGREDDHMNGKLHNEDELGEEEDEEDKHISLKKIKAPKRKLRSSIVDDKFFKLEEMEEFLEAEDAKEMQKHNKTKLNDEEDDGINYFAENLGDKEDLGADDGDGDDSENENNPKYKDFFDMEENELSEEPKTKNKRKQKDHFADKAEQEEFDKNEDSDDNQLENEQDESEADSENENNPNEHIEKEPASDSDSNEDDNVKPKSSFEQRQERLQLRIREYEDEVLGEKPWQLKGEIQATNRPQNSLLEEILEFESTVRPAPVITEETTLRLEDIIRQRIKDQAWDDVVTKVRPLQTPHEYRKQLVLDQEKSKESLAQIYEKEYQRELDKLDPNRDDTTATTEEPKEHKEIRSLMRTLFVKLDALSNFHFTPKPIAPEPRIITNTPAVTMEEVAPVAVSDAKLLAPEELYRGHKHELLGKSERNRTDKNRERRKKKEKQRAIHKALDAKDVQRQKLGIPASKKHENAKLLKTLTKQRNVEKMTVNNDHAALKSSKAFFSKLQDTTNATNVAATKKATKKKPDATALSAKKLKL